MDKNMYYLITLMEECAELQQAASKILRFGPSGFDPRNPNMTNREDLLTEYCHVTAMLEMLIENSYITNFSANEIDKIKVEKKSKVEWFRVERG